MSELDALENTVYDRLKSRAEIKESLDFFVLCILKDEFDLPVGEPATFGRTCHSCIKMKLDKSKLVPRFCQYGHICCLLKAFSWVYDNHSISKSSKQFIETKSQDQVFELPLETFDKMVEDVKNVNSIAGSGDASYCDGEDGDTIKQLVGR